MRIGEFFDGAGPASAAASLPPVRHNEQDMTALVRVLPKGGADLALTHLDNLQIHKLAVICRELETFRQSPALAKVPTSAAEAHAVADIIKNAASAVAELERSRKARVQPLNDQTKAINGLYKMLTEPLEALRATADRLVLAHNQAERARIQREQEEQRRRMEEAAQAEAIAIEQAGLAADEEAREKALLAAEVASKQIATATAFVPAEAPRAYKSESGTVGIRKTYKLDTFDPDKIPAEYFRREPVLEAVRKELSKAVRAGARQIDGCVIVEEEGTTAR